MFRIDAFVKKTKIVIVGNENTIHQEQIARQISVQSA